MIFIKVNELNEVIFRHLMPFDEKHGLKKTKEQLLLEGYLISEIPEPENNGMIPKLKFDGENLFYEYSELTPAPKVNEFQELRNEVAELREQNNHLVDTLDMVLTDLIPSLFEGGEPV